MYDELVKRLWECASGECFNCSQYTPTTNASVCSKELMKQAADAIEELAASVEGFEAQTNMVLDRDGNNTVIRFEPKWIPVTERLPDEEGYYLTIGPYGAFRVCYYGPSLKHRGYQVFLDQNRKKINAIAWMKIPRYKTKEEK